MPSFERLHIFVGPTAGGLDLKTHLPPGAVVHPPARRGDVSELVAAETTGALLLVDGTYHAHPAVGHAELREAISAGWNVWGVSSMGAIRAYEMRHLGMRGYGFVYSRFLEEQDFQDDEVALVHTRSEPYAPLSEPLIHIRVMLDGLVKDGLLTQDAAASTISSLKKLWFGYRTLPRLTQTLAQSGTHVDLSYLQHAICQYRVKTTDLCDFLESRQWLRDHAPATAPY